MGMLASSSFRCSDKWFCVLFSFKWVTNICVRSAILPAFQGVGDGLVVKFGSTGGTVKLSAVCGDGYWLWGNLGVLDLCA